MICRLYTCQKSPQRDHLVHILFLSLPPSGTHSATPCPPGTMNPNSGGLSIDNCTPCQAGHYCEGTGLSAPSGVCSERYYCPSDAMIDSPEPMGYECPAGFYCLNQTATPTACDPGTLIVAMDTSHKNKCLSHGQSAKPNSL